MSKACRLQNDLGNGARRYKLASEIAALILKQSWCGSWIFFNGTLTDKHYRKV